MADDPKPEPKLEAVPDLAKLVDAAVAKHGDHTSALKAFAADLYAARDDLKSARAGLPAAGAIVLTGDDAKAWGRYRAAGDPKALETALTERDSYKTEADGFRREKLHADVARVAGFNPVVLSRLAMIDKLDLNVRDVKGKDGKPVATAVVLGKDDKDVETVTLLTDHAAKHWQDFLPSLKPEEGTQAKPAARPPGTPPRFESTRRTTEPTRELPSAESRLLAAGIGSY